VLPLVVADVLADESDDDALDESDDVLADESDDDALDESDGDAGDAAPEDDEPPRESVL